MRRGGPWVDESHERGGGTFVPSPIGRGGPVLEGPRGYRDAVDIAVEDFIRFCERTIGFHADAVRRLDDQQVNTVPRLPGANSPYRLVTHALAACEWWTGHIVCGRPSARDRDSEFRSAGTVADLVAATEAAVVRLRQLEPELDAATELRHPAHTTAPLLGEWTVGAALMHTYEELAQHLGHLEITVDLILAGDGG